MLNGLGPTGGAVERAHPGASPVAPGSKAPGDALRARLYRLCRQCATGLSFALVGASGLVLALTVLPLCRLLPGDCATREARVQRLIHLSYGWCLGLMSGLRLHRMRFEGFERLRTRGPHLIVANHPSLIDFGIVISQLPQADCIVSDSWARSFWLGRLARAAGYVVNSRGAAAVEECVARLRAGRTVLLFPEGTRSPKGGLWPFRRGAAHVALRSGCNLELVTIRCDPPALLKGQPWWDVPDRRVEYRVRVEEPVRVQDAAWEGVPDVLAARRLTAVLRERTAEGLQRVH